MAIVSQLVALSRRVAMAAGQFIVSVVKSVAMASQFAMAAGRFIVSVIKSMIMVGMFIEVVGQFIVSVIVLVAIASQSAIVAGVFVECVFYVRDYKSICSTYRFDVSLLRRTFLIEKAFSWTDQPVDHSARPV